MNFLQSVQGNYILSGQMEIAWSQARKDEDFNYIIANTGKTPAVRGFDFLQYVYSPSVRAGQDATERAITWAKNGGIVTFCCHMFMNIGSAAGAPQFYVPAANNGVGTTFDIRQAVIPGTPENIEYLAKLDIIASELTKLRDAGVPVVWRPFHECSGGWFWWGAHGPTPLIQAWRIMFDRFTNLRGLNNLIWCFNPTDTIATNMPAWYPGDDVVDMISNDVYPTAGTHPSFATEYQQMRDFKSGRKVVAMSENGSIPDPDTMFTEGAGWAFFCTWNGFENDTSRNSVAFLQKVYNHAKVITLDELPAFYSAFTLEFTTQPASQTVVFGANVTFSAASSSAPAPAFQWRKNGVNIAGATSNVYSLYSVTSGDAGNYTVVATNSTGSVTSNTATLSVIVAPSDAVIAITVE